MIKNVQYRDVDFVKKKQNVELIDGVYYCKVYSNGIDYFHLCEVNMRRIESIFNIFRFNRETSIDFDYSKDVIIKRSNIVTGGISCLRIFPVWDFSDLTPFR